MSVTHVPKAGPLLTGTEWESASTHVVHTASISDTDPGAIGAGNLWLIPNSDNDWGSYLFIRNPANDAWLGIKAVTSQPFLDTDGPGVFINTDDDDTNGHYIELVIQDPSNPVRVIVDVTGINLNAGNFGQNAIFLSADATRLGFTVGGAAQISSNVLDPSVGGQAAPKGSLHLSLNEGAFIKLDGADDHAWARIGTQAAFVEPTTATPEQIVNAMIASGLMAPS